MAKVDVQALAELFKEAKSAAVAADPGDGARPVSHRAHKAGRAFVAPGPGPAQF